MPVSHNAILRYQALDACFSDFNRYYFIEDLIVAVNRLLENNGQAAVSKRTVQYDIQKMESNHDWNVLFESTLLLLNQFKGLPQFEKKWKH